MSQIKPMLAIFPQLKVSTKSVFVCELLVTASMDAHKICNWLRANQAREINFFEKNIDNEIFWAINFCTDNERLVTQLQDRCREKAQENLQQKDQRIEELVRKVEELREKSEDLQIKLANQDTAITSLQSERERLKSENDTLERLESDYHSLQRVYQNKNSKLVEIERELKELQAKNPKFRSQNNQSREVLSSRLHVWADVCLVCGKQSMPGQGICLDCSR